MTTLEKLKRLADKAKPTRGGIRVNKNGPEMYAEWERQRRLLELKNRSGHVRRAERPDREPAGIRAAERGR